LSISGSDALSISGSDVLSISGSDVLSISGSDALSISGSDALSISGSDALSISGSDVLSISGSDVLSISGGDALGISGSDLLALGSIDYVGDGFISVLGQTVFAELGGLGTGTTVAVYGSIDTDTGGIVGAQIVPMSSSYGGASYLRGIVDTVDLTNGLAVISGMTVNYSNLLSNDGALQVGSEVSVVGWSYSGLGLLVADPLLSLD
jgi:hypothetical protein